MRAMVCVGCFSLVLLAGCGGDEEVAAAPRPQKPGFVVCDEADIRAHALEAVSISDGIQICNELKLAKGNEPTERLYTSMAKAFVAFRLKGSSDTAKDLTYQLMGIVDARGQSKDEQASITTFDVVFKMYSAWNGHITPKDVNAFLHDSGPASASLSDDGLVNMMAVVLEEKRARGWQ
ncbi:hypothetical protein [Chromobacterium haemolyticum]|uniref:hypothetical protein n=1 Tax=Chromobacterium haemolyticum TaxID=394935 RepID=UPI0013169459|nr:hypothetical protein [Chromobacterium haemolyticum]BBH11749.1 hypothetical protein CH06BL_09970 [Chromobacterium haemolyticum]